MIAGLGMGSRWGARNRGAARRRGVGVLLVAYLGSGWSSADPGGALRWSVEDLAWLDCEYRQRAILHDAGWAPLPRPDFGFGNCADLAWSEGARAAWESYVKEAEPYDRCVALWGLKRLGGGALGFVAGAFLAGFAVRGSLHGEAQLLYLLVIPAGASLGWWTGWLLTDRFARRCGTRPAPAWRADPGDGTVITK